MKLRKSFQEIICEGGVAPKGYGVAYRDFLSYQVICYPIPIHFIIRHFRNLYHFYLRYFVYGGKPSSVDELIIEAKRQGGELAAKRVADRNRFWKRRIELITGE